jgi:hypothetical protein
MRQPHRRRGHIRRDSASSLVGIRRVDGRPSKPTPATAAGWARKRVPCRNQKPRLARMKKIAGQTLLLLSCLNREDQASPEPREQGLSLNCQAGMITFLFGRRTAPRIPSRGCQGSVQKSVGTPAYRVPVSPLGVHGCTFRAGFVP